MSRLIANLFSYHRGAKKYPRRGYFLKIRFLSKTMGERLLNPYKKLYKILFLTCNTIKISKYIRTVC